MSVRIPSPLLLLLLLSGLALPASADVVTGHVVDSNGLPVAGVDIDIKTLGGDDLPIIDDGTDASGNFSIVVPAGLYDVLFFPPAPPVTTHLSTVVEDVVVVGTKNLGTIVLPPGVAVTGRCVTTTAIPVAGVNLDVHLDGGGDLLLKGDTTGPTGQFSLAVPTQPLELRFKTFGAVWPSPLAPKALPLSPVSSINLGDVVLLPGFIVSGTLAGPGGPLSGGDIDVNDAVTGDEVYTPDDNTDDSGDWSIVLAAGIYDVQYCPPTGALLVSKETKDVVVSAGLSLGTTVLSPGVVLSGTVKNAAGQPLASVDVDVTNSFTDVEVPLCNDNTSASGVYSVVVPTGTFDVEFEPPYSIPYGSATVLDQVITGPKTVNGVLPSCPFFVNYGVGTAGTGGFVPHLQTSGGAPRGGNPNFTYQLSKGLGGAPAVLAASLFPSSLPLFGGIVLVDVTHLLATVPLTLSGPAGAGGVGAASFKLPVPITPSLYGFTIYNQFIAIDFAAPASFSMSEGMSYTFCP